jgi:apolipoprotein N-acyltransferase
MQYWISHTMVYLSGFTWWAAILVLMAYVIVYGSSHALFGVLYGWIRKYTGRTGWVIITPIAWVVLERKFPSLFPYYAGNALYEVPVLMQSAEICGIGGVSALVFLANCALAHSVEERARGRASDYFIPIAASSIWVLISVWGVVRMSQVWSAPTHSNLRVAMIQPNVTVEEKRDPLITSRANAWQRTVEMTQNVLSKTPDLIIWPEGGFPFQFILDSTTRPTRSRVEANELYSWRLYRLALDLGVDLVAGGLRLNGDATRNSAMYFPKDDTAAQVYDKQQLLPFGEHIPLADRFTILKEAVEGMTHHEKGDTDVTWSSQDVKMAVGICYEAIFPEVTRRQMNHADANVLLNLTNDVWFGDTAAPYLHLMVQQARAIEMRAWLLRSTNSGISAYIDPTGRIRQRSLLDTQDTLISDLSIPNVSPSLYRTYGDLWLHLASLLCLLSLWRGWVIDRKKNISSRNLPAQPLSHGMQESLPNEDCDK